MSAPSVMIVLPTLGHRTETLELALGSFGNRVSGGARFRYRS